MFDFQLYKLSLRVSLNYNNKRYIKSADFPLAKWRNSSSNEIFLPVGQCVEQRKGKTHSHSAGSRVVMLAMSCRMNCIRYVEFSVRV